MVILAVSVSSENAEWLTKLNEDIEIKHHLKFGVSRIVDTIITASIIDKEKIEKIIIDKKYQDINTMTMRRYSKKPAKSRRTLK